MSLIKYSELPTQTELLLLKSLVNTSRLNYEEKNNLFREIEGCIDYTHFRRIEMYLESIQKGLDEISNPSQKQISQHLKRFI